MSGRPSNEVQTDSTSVKMSCYTLQSKGVGTGRGKNNGTTGRTVDGQECGRVLLHCVSGKI